MWKKGKGNKRKDKENKTKEKGNQRKEKEKWKLRKEKGAKVNFRNLYWTIIGQERKKFLKHEKWERSEEKGEKWKMSEMNEEVEKMRMEKDWKRKIKTKITLLQMTLFGSMIKWFNLK